MKRQKLKLKRIRKKEKKKQLKITQNTNTDNTNTTGNQTPKTSKTPITNGIKSANLKGGFTSPGCNQYSSLSPSDNGSISKFNASSEKSVKIGQIVGKKGLEGNDMGNHTLQELRNSNHQIVNCINKDLVSQQASVIKNNQGNKQKMKKIANGKVEVIEDTQSTSNSSNTSSSTMMKLIGNTKLNQCNTGKNKNEKDKIKILEENKSTRSNKFHENYTTSGNSSIGMIKPLKLNIQLSSVITSSMNNNTNNNVIDKEAELLKAMGWSENNSEDNIEIDENEINQIKKKWKEIVEHRDVFRKNAREKFKQFISAAGDNGKSKF